MANELTHVTAAAPGGMTLMGDPKAMIAQAKKAADALMAVVKQKGWAIKIGGQEHVKVEAWETVAHFYGVTARITETEAYTDELTGAAGFKAHADALLVGNGQVISSATAICLNNEDNWSVRPKYEKVNGERRKTGDEPVPSFQLQSMAQTRAISKVLRGVFAFVVALAGYSTTPAEEITGSEQHNGEPQPEQSNGKEHANRISDPQRKRLFAIAHEVSCPMNNLALLFQKKYGFAQAFEITRDKYDALIEDVRNWQKIPEAQPAPPKEGAA